MWTRPGVLAGAVIAVVIYGSLIPFDFQWSSAVAEHGGVIPAVLNTLASPQWIAAKKGESALGLSFAASDLLINLLLYVPLGVSLRMALRMVWRSWWFEVLGTFIVALALSWLVESLQSLMPMRVASRNDVLANSGAALAAALVARGAWESYKACAFWSYCRLGGVLGRLRRIAQQPRVAITIAILNAVIIGMWFMGEVQRSGIGDASTALPFERVFALPYDMGALVLGEALLAYAGIGCLLLLLTYTGVQRVAMGWVVLVVVVLAFATEISRAATNNAAPDITGPLLALSAASIMGVTIYTFSYAVKRSNRRHRDTHFDGPDRRDSSHRYAR